MKKSIFVLSIILAGCAGQTDTPETSDSTDLIVWYDKPASGMGDALPLGNGVIGAKVFGDPENDRIALNHEWLWRDRKLRDRSNPDVAHHLPEIRKLFFDGKIIDGSNAANNLLGSQRIPPNLGSPPMNTYGPDPFQPAGDIHIAFPDHQNVANYRRHLDLASGTIQLSYEHEGVQYTRKHFTSIADSVLVVNLSADQPGKITCRIQLSRIFDPECKIIPWTDGTPSMAWTNKGSDAWAEGNKIGFTGEFVEGKHFAVSATVSATGSNVRTSWNDGWPEFRVDGADEAFLLLSIATDYETDNPQEHTVKQIARLADQYGGFQPAADAHLKAYDQIFGRAEFQLAGPDRSFLPMDQRLRQFKEGEHDPGLNVLFYQYGRYILLSSSGIGGLPSNLYGIWSEPLRPQWSGDFHHDINIQHYYWPAEVNNLPECAEALCGYLDRCIPAAKIAAKNLYGCDGIFIPLTTGAWARCLKTEPGGTDLSKERGGWDEWTGAAAWLSQHYWWHYEFSRDEEFLRERAYPFMKEVALFYEDFLIPDPRPDSPHYGQLVTVPSVSPENSFEGGTRPNSIGIGSTSDFLFIRDVLSHCIAATEILGIDEDKRLEWTKILENIPALQVGKHGQLQEWLVDYEEPEPGHRHVTHLMGLFMGDQITVEESPVFARAAGVSLERRLEHGGGGGLTPGCGIWARLREGDLAEEHLREWRVNFSSGETPPAGSAEIAEMLMQSHQGRIRLLPALPEIWPEGRIGGFRARGGFEVDISWSEGKLTEAVIVSKAGGFCNILSAEPLQLKDPDPAIVNESTVINYDFQKKSGEQLKDYSLEFMTEEGKSYVLVPE